MKASTIASYLNSIIIGEDKVVTGISSLFKPKLNTLIFCTDNSFNFNSLVSKQITILISNTIELYPSNKITYIRVKNPILDFIKISTLFEIFPEKPSIHPSVILKNCKIETSIIMNNCKNPNINTTA